MRHVGRLRFGMLLMGLLPPAVVGAAGAVAVVASLVVLVRFIALVRRPAEVTRRWRGVARFQQWTPRARASFVREQRNRGVGSLAVGVVLIVLAIARS